MSDIYASVAEEMVSITRADHREMLTMSELGRVLGRNIERAAALVTLAFSMIIIIYHPTGAVYQLLARLMPIEMWGWVLAVLATARGVTLIVNGWWPVTLQVRVAFSLATLIGMWGALTVAFWFVSVNPDNAHAAFLPGVVLAPFALVVEVLCFMSLRIRIVSNIGAKSAYVGHGGSSDSGGRD
jgi:hypothetical protein